MRKGSHGVGLTVVALASMLTAWPLFGAAHPSRSIGQTARSDSSDVVAVVARFHEALAGRRQRRCACGADTRRHDPGKWKHRDARRIPCASLARRHSVCTRGALDAHSDSRGRSRRCRLARLVIGDAGAEQRSSRQFCRRRTGRVAAHDVGMADQCGPLVVAVPANDVTRPVV
jgi:hypothetical protein